MATSFPNQVAAHTPLLFFRSIPPPRLLSYTTPDLTPFHLEREKSNRGLGICSLPDLRGISFTSVLQFTKCLWDGGNEAPLSTPQGCPKTWGDACCQLQRSTQKEVMVLMLLLPPLVTGCVSWVDVEALSPGSLWIWELESRKRTDHKNITKTNKCFTGHRDEHAERSLFANPP